MNISALTFVQSAMTLPNEIIPFAVVTWKHANCGGESLVYHYTPGQPFAVVTGPTPWGAGSWGPFPPEAILSVRRLQKHDSWTVSGCPSRRWTAREVLEQFTRQAAYNGQASCRSNAARLTTAIEEAE